MALIEDRQDRRSDLASLGSCVLAGIPPPMSTSQIKKLRAQQLKKMQKGRA
jgi:hypothetical protein